VLYSERVELQQQYDLIEERMQTLARECAAVPWWRPLKFDRLMKEFLKLDVQAVLLRQRLR
jgi:hypothetical protein